MSWFKKLGLRTKVLITVGIACFICGSISLMVALYYKDIEFREGLVEKSRTIHGRLAIAAKYAASQGGLEPMIKLYTAKYSSSSELTEEDKRVILQQVPIYASMKIGAENSEKESYNFRVFSSEARKKDNQATAEEMKIFNRFESDPKLEEITESEGNSVVVYRPIRLQESHGCFTCHGDPATSPWKNGKDILGYQMENWKDGKLHGVFAISNDVAAIVKANTKKGGFFSTLLLAIFIFVGANAALFLASLIIRGPVDTLWSVANRLSGAGNQVGTAASDIVLAAHSLSNSATEQASSLQETAASIEEMSAMVSKNSGNSMQAADTSNQSKQRVEAGKTAVLRMSQSMEEINSSNDEIVTQITNSNKQMADIVKVIQEIGNKTKVINDIVFQTKLLSFNASVEAARAGEHGKGSAVVAEEVGNLAQMSGNASKEIFDMLESSIHRVETMIQETQTKVEGLIQKGKDRVSSGMEIAQECSTILEEIVQNVSEVSHMANEISEASQEQSQGIHEINKAVGQLDEVTQQNAGTSIEVSNFSSKLAEQANEMRNAVAHLMITLEGGEIREESGRQPPSTSREEPHSSTSIATPAPKTNALSKKKTIGLAENGKETLKSHGVKNSTQEKIAALNSPVTNGHDTVPDQEDPRFEDVA